MRVVFHRHDGKSPPYLGVVTLALAAVGL
jgi:hypothetical protein